MDEVLQERLRLAEERAAQLKEEAVSEEAFSRYFRKEAEWLSGLFELQALLENGGYEKLGLEELKAWNRRLYEELQPENYETSYANPAFTVKELGKEFGAFFAALHTELRQSISHIHYGRIEEFAAAVELFLEVAGEFACAWEEEHALPAFSQVKQSYYWYMSDYADIRSERQVLGVVVPSMSMAKKIVMESDLSDLRYLYRYGDCVSDDELRMASYLNSLPEETIAVMADTFTEGYRLGFIATNKDISIKKSVGIYYNVGFERVVRKAVENFRKIGLEAVIDRNGISCTPPNRQYSYDHKDDDVLFLDKQYMNRKLETMRCAYEKYKEEAAVYGGPAVIEVFGEEPFAPVIKEEAHKPDDAHRKLSVEYAASFRQLRSEYIKDEERSFTIIAFPTPAIGEQFEEIFDETIRINTLDYNLYRQIQQSIIDVLDTAEYVEIKGMNGNRTDLRVALWKLQNPEKETKFENCVADVNIPVGEVFTSPVLKGTEGVLHVSKVFLNELEYKDFEMRFQDGMTADYGCGNFKDAVEGRNYIKENVLFNHDSLPMGEFAIGTNTTAYVMAQKYNIGAKLPILIAEKTGPHFAVGDTCYCHVEDVKVYNPDGKEIVARDNEVAALRSEDMRKAYFNCHTDITIPYNELGSLAAVHADGTKTVIIENGRFVLAGCEELNVPLNE